MYICNIINKNNKNMNNKVTDIKLNLMKNTCDKIVNKISNIVGNDPDYHNFEVTTSYDIADYTTRMTLAYLLKYGLINKDLFLSFGELSDDDMNYINNELDKIK